MSTVFAGGSRSVSRLPAQAKERLDTVVASGFPVIVGDANGADKAVQKHLLAAQYRKVTVFCSGDSCRNNLGKWETRFVRAPRNANGFDFYAAKDREMAESADLGFMIWDGKSPGTLLNILRLVRAGKKALLVTSPGDESVTFKSIRDWTAFVDRCPPAVRRDVRRRATPEEWPLDAPRQPDLLYSPSPEPAKFTGVQEPAMNDTAPPPAKARRLNLIPGSGEVALWTDHYFNRSKGIVGRFGDVRVTYAIFMRRPVVSAPRLMIEWLESIAAERGTRFDIDLVYREGKWVGAGEPILYLSGSFHALVDLETIWLQKLGASCVAAYNAYTMCAELPKTAFLAFDARHCASIGMAELMAYAASVGSARARRKHGALGFVGNATDATAHFFGKPGGLGTMPHAIIGYAGSTVRAAEMFHETYPNVDLTVLVDYYGRELSDSLAVCRRFPALAASGTLSLRLDTMGSRYMEGLDPTLAYKVLDRHAPEAIRGYRTESELRHLVGAGVSAAAIWLLRETLDDAGFPKVRIVGSSGFGPEKCRVMALARAPVDAVGTGSFLPDNWHETYATADIIQYGDRRSVKVGREFLFPKD
jgi:nicotinate phosphoribosyltransferase